MSGTGARSRRRYKRQGIRALAPLDYEVVGEQSSGSRNEIIEAVRCAMREQTLRKQGLEDTEERRKKLDRVRRNRSKQLWQAIRTSQGGTRHLDT